MDDSARTTSGLASEAPSRLREEAAYHATQRASQAKLLQSASKRQYAFETMVQDKLLQERLEKQMQGVPVQGVPCPVMAEELQRKRSKGEERDEETQLGSEVCVLGAWKLQQTDSRHMSKWRRCGSFWRKVLQCQPRWR